MKEIHIVPLNDEEHHEKRITCVCSPRLDYPSDDCVIVAHYAFDSRNVIEDLVEELAVELNYGGWGIFVREE